MTTSGPKLVSEIFEESGSDFFWTLSGTPVFFHLEMLTPTPVRQILIKTSHGYEFTAGFHTVFLLSDAAGNIKETLFAHRLRKNMYIKLFPYRYKTRHFWGGDGTFYEGYERADDLEVTTEDAVKSAEYYKGLITGLFDKHSDIKIIHDNRMMIAIQMKDEKSAKLLQRMFLFFGAMTYRQDSYVLYPEGLLKQLSGIYIPRVSNDVTNYLKIHMPLVVVKDKRILSYATKITDITFPDSSGVSGSALVDTFIVVPEDIKRVINFDDLRGGNKYKMFSWTIDVGGPAGTIFRDLLLKAHNYRERILKERYEDLADFL